MGAALAALCLLTPDGARAQSPAAESPLLYDTLHGSLDSEVNTLQAGKPFSELYVHPATPDPKRPVQEMKGFARVSLPPGDAAVTIPLDPSDFEIWDTASHAWKVVPGAYEVRVGASSRDIRLCGMIRVQ